MQKVCGSVAFIDAPRGVAAQVLVMHPAPVTSQPPSTTSTLPPAVIDWIDANGAKARSQPLPALLDKELYLARPIRKGGRYRGQRNYHGQHWFAPTGELLWFESMFERSALIRLEFTCDIVALTTQPMKIKLPDGKLRYPDFLALHADGRQVVYDVKPTALITEKVLAQFRATQLICAQVGWEYEVIENCDEVLLANIETLADFRQNYFAPDLATTRRILNALERPLSVADTAEAAGLPTWSAGMAAVYHLAWLGQLTINLTIPLSTRSTVERTPTC